MIQRQTSLSGNVVQFCRYLRQQGFPVSAEEEMAALKALQFIDLNSFYHFSLALKSMLCRSKEQLDEFEGLFNAYWQELGKAVDAKLKDEPEKKLPLRSQQEQFKSLKAWLFGNGKDGEEEAATYSTHESLSKKNFTMVPEEDVEELKKAIKALSKQMAAKANRRYERSWDRQLPDLRQTIRKNIRRGGELLEIVFRKPKKNRVKLVLLCDVSRSMELYTAFLIQFMYSFQQVVSRMETFVFSTSLKRITSLLKENSFREAMQLLSNENNGWDGGTRIGESLRMFSSDYAKKLIDKKTIVIILSDGWDTGDIALLQQNMELIHHKSKKLIWLNPLAGYSEFQPEVAGMKAALPFTDIFLPAHNIDSLRKLGKHLGT